MAKTATALTPGSPQATAAIRICLLSVMIDYAGVGMMRTILPFYAKQLGGTATLIGLLETCYGVGQVIGAAVLGRMSDVQGRRVVLFISCAGSAVGYGMAGMATTPLFLLLSRIPVGLAKQTVSVSRAILADCTDSAELSSMMAWLTSLMGIGYAMGPLVGGSLGEWFGDEVPAFVAVALFLALIPLIAVYLPETCPAVTKGGPQEQLKTFKSFEGDVAKEDTEVKAQKLSSADRRGVRMKMFMTLAMLSLPEFAVVIFSTTGLSTLVQSVGEGRTFLGRINSAIATIAAITSGIIVPWMSKTKGVSDRLWDLPLQFGDIRWLLAIGFGTFGLSSMALAFIPSRDGILCTLLPMSMALSLLRSSPPAFLSKSTPAEMQGEAMGALNAASSVCRVIAPLLAGFLVDAVSQAAPFWLCGGLAFAGLLALGYHTSGDKKSEGKEKSS